MYWLAINRDGTTLAALANELVPSVAKGKILETLESLSGRSLIERDRARFTLQPVVMEYVTERAIETAIAEICQQAPQFLFTHALIEAQAPEYIGESQRKLILAPLLARLRSQLGDRPKLIQLFQQNLALLQTQNRQAAPAWPSLDYGAGNLINLLCHLQADLTGTDFSGLTIRQAYLRDTSLQQANFANVNAIDCAFAEAMNDIYGLAYSPDGTLVATIGIAGILAVYRVTTGEWLYAIAAHASVAMGITFDRAGTSIYTSSFDRQIRQWDAATGNCLRSWQTDSLMWAIALSPDDKYLASGHDNNTIQIWDLQTLDRFSSLPGHTNMVTSIDFHPQLPLLVSSSMDGTFKLWNYQTGECLQTATAHTNVVWDVKFQPDGKGIASASNDGSAKLWNLDLECLHTFEIGVIHGRPTAFSPDGQIFACGCTDANIRLWDVESGRLLRVFPTGRNLWNIVFSPDGGILVSSSDAAQVKFWDVKLGQCNKTLQGESINFWTIAFEPHGTLLATGGDNMRLRLWDVAGGKCVQTLTGHTSRIATIVFHPQQPLLATGCWDGTIKLWDLQGQCLHTLLEENFARIQAIAFHPTRSLIASGGFDATIQFWDTATGRSVRTLSLPARDALICAIAFNPQGNLLACGNDGGALLLWDVESGALIWQLSAHQIRLWTLDFHPDGQRLASGGHDGTVRIWDTATGECVTALDRFPGKVMSVKFSPDGTLLAISCESIVQIWDLPTQTPIRTLVGHAKLIYSVAFDPARPQILVSAGDDGTIREWDITTGECLQVLRPDRIYEGMNIAGSIGFSEGQRATLKALGAVE